MEKHYNINRKLSKPPWLKVSFPSGERFNWIKNKSNSLNLSTVCEEAKCPNIGECWNSGTATFMLMGDTCTRGCRFCSVKTSKKPLQLDDKEPFNVAKTINLMKLKYVVLTTVDRDDLDDQGAFHIARCIKSVKRMNNGLLVEILMPDFRGENFLIDKVINSQPDVLAHNLETVKRLTYQVRDPRAGYNQSLEVLKYLKDKNKKTYTKSSIMLGLGETKKEILDSMIDLRNVGVDFLTLGQYLQPTKKHIKVKKFLSPDEFDYFKGEGEKLGFKYVASGPLVRSSYKAAEFFIESMIKKKNESK